MSGSAASQSAGSATAGLFTGALPGRALAGSLGLILPLGLLALLIGLFGAGAMTSAFILMLVSLVAVVGIQIYSGNSGIISFGHTGFMAVGAYLSAWLTMPVEQKAKLLPGLPDLLLSAELSLLPALLVVALAVGCFAFLSGLIVARLDGAAAAITTLGLLVIVNGVLVSARDLTRGSQALYGVPVLTTLPVVLVAAALAILAARLFRSSRAGLELRAAREDAAAAAACGVNAVRRRLAAWVLSAVIVGVAGALYGHYLGVLTPKAFYFDLTFQLLAMLIVGGLNSISGAVAGTLLVTLMIEILRRLEGGFTVAGIAVGEVFGLTQVGLSLAILAVMYLRRQGLVGHFELDERLRPPAPVRDAAPPAPFVAAGEGIRAAGLEKRFGGLVAVSEVSLSLAPGEIVGLIGPNGAGKSTLLALLSGTLSADKGSVSIDGAPAGGLPAFRIARRAVARTFQNIRLFGELSVLDNVRVTAAIPVGGQRPSPALAEARVAGLLEAFGLTADAARPARTLAYGPQRRLEIARALALRPRYLLLDEPAAGMNSAESDRLLEQLSALRRDSGIGLLVVDHDLRLIMRLCDRVIVMNKGQVIADGTPAAVRENPAVIEAYLGRKRRAKVNERGERP